MHFTNIKRRKIHEDVAEQIENQIINGALKEGSSLPSERELMEIFNVGRPAVREAILLLQRNGFILVSSSGRPMVCKPSASNVIDQLSSAAKFLLSFKEGEQSFQEARRLFESAIAKNAAIIATEQDIESLKLALHENEKSIGNVKEFERTDVNFHLAIANIGNNSVFKALHTAIAEWLSMQRKVSLRIEGVEKKAFNYHKKIYEAIASKDPEGAWLAMDNHLIDIMKEFQKGKSIYNE